MDFLKDIYNDLKNLPLAYAAPALAVLAAAVWRFYAYEIVLRRLPIDIWVWPTALAGAVWIIIYLTWVRPPKKTPEGKIGFWVARIEGDKGNRQQSGILSQLHKAIDKHSELRKSVIVRDLKKRVPHASPGDQAYTALRLGEKVNATQVIWLAQGEKDGQIYHTVVKPTEEGSTEPRAIPVPDETDLGRYFAGHAFGMIGEYEKAIAEFAPREESPELYAAQMNNLGAMYLELPTGNRTANLRRATEIFNETLGIYTRNDFPAQWAMTQNNLGAAYAHLPTGDKSQNIHQAINYYQAALRVLTRETLPREWAMTQNNLGNAYADLRVGNRTENLGKAIGGYQGALSVYNHQDFPREWAGTMNNLGTAYAELSTGDRAENQRKAIECYHSALTIRTKANFPADWAMTQNNLGNAYLNLPSGDRSQNLRKAIESFRAALSVRTKEAFPIDWALTQANFGNVYWVFPTGDRRLNLEKAIGAYRNALTLLTPESFPHYNGTVSKKLALAEEELAELE